MNKKENSVRDWIVAFQKGTSFWKNSVHVDEFLGKGLEEGLYYLKSFSLLAELIASANETGVIKDHYLCLSFYLKTSTTLALEKPNLSRLWNDFSSTPPELCLIERAISTERGTIEAYEKPISLEEMDGTKFLRGQSQNIRAYYTSWRSNGSADDEYERAVIVEYR